MKKRRCGNRKIIRRGAEAVLYLDRWHNRKVMVKERVVKGYRHPVIDGRLRSERLKTEARLFREARMLGVSVPIIYDIDIDGNRIVMEYLGGRQAREVINDAKVSGGKKEELCREIGKAAGRLHRGNVVHGDLTTSNILVAGGRISFIDFSMGARNGDIERKGVDIHLLKEAFQSAHSENFELFSYVLIGYLREYECGREVVKKMKEIEERGRYSRNAG